jgi:ABC-2 type transport system ATP-binding protein
MEYLLELENVSKKYKRFQLQQVSFRIKPGSITGFVGINGSGKSTTIKIIADLIRGDSGTVKFFGTDRTKQCFNEQIGYVMDSSYFYEKQTLRAVKNIISSAYQNWNENEYQHYMELFQLEEKQKIQELSKGNKMKYALTLALSHNARLLIMDEPTSGLDPLVRKETMKVLKDFVSDGTRSVLFSTHITSDLEKAADTILFIHNGKIIFDEALNSIPALHKKTLGKAYESLENSMLDFIEHMKQGGVL